MHEWALAEAVLESVRAQAAGHPGERPARVTVTLGELQSIEVDVFAEGLKQLGDDGVATTSPETAPEFAFEIEPAVFACTACGKSWALSECNLDEATTEAIHFLPEVVHSFVSCPSCGSADFRVVRGRGVSISGIDFLPEADHD